MSKNDTFLLERSSFIPEILMILFFFYFIGTLSIIYAQSLPEK